MALLNTRIATLGVVVMKALIRKILEKASFHGFAYIARRDIHLLERILWGIMLLFGTYFSVSICLDQWERYKDNPTVFGVERVIGTRQFPFVGVTMCSNYFDHKQAELIIKKTWNVNPDDEKFNYYMKFLHVLTEVKYNNLEVLKPYKNDASVNSVPFLEIIWDIRAPLFSSSTKKTTKNEPLGGLIDYGNSNSDKDNQTHFSNVITEVGMCVSTSFLHEYQNPLGFQREPEMVEYREMCSPFDVCNLKVSPSLNDGDKTTAYIHNNKDIVPQDDYEVIHREMTVNQITNFDVNLELMSAEADVRNVPIKYRKCRFTDENDLKYFKTYRPILCRNECRINAALKLCNCKPYFYVVGPGPICTLRGMLCLANTNWKETKCEQCVDLCSVIKYTALKATAHNYSSTKFERSLLITLNLPKMGIRRRVVFSFDQLVVAFGGAASLFLGCSFLSIAQILYYCIQSFEEKLKRWCSKFK